MSDLAVVILSRSDDNVMRAVQSVRAHEPTDLPIIVIDDGLHPITWRLLDKLDVRRLAPIARWSIRFDGSCIRQPREQEFVFAKNANVGLRAAFSSNILAAVLMNDDCELQTDHGFTHMSAYSSANRGVGLCSAAFDTAVNPWQTYSQLGESIAFVRSLMFPCVLIPKHTFDLVGPLDERFVGYGFDDIDYCTRVIEAGYTLAVDHSCYVTHSGRSEYRSKPGWEVLMSQNAERYERKRKGMCK